MTDKEKSTGPDQASELPAKDAPSAQPETAPQTSGPPQQKRTTGNKIFDWGVYSSIAWLGVSVMSLVTAHEAIHGTNKNFDWLRALNKKFSGTVEKGLSKTIMKNSPPENVKSWAEGTGLYYMLGLGGTTLMAPIKWMEDNRQKLAGKIDTAIGTTPPDPESIKKEPKQTWGSVLAGRVFSVVGIGFTAFVLMGPKNADRISKWFGKHFTASFMKLRPQSNEKIVRKWADMGAFDILFTAITAAATYGFSRFVATKHDKKVDGEEELYRLNPSNPQALEPHLAHHHQHLHHAAPETTFADKIKPREKLPEPEMLHAQKLAAAPGQNTPSLA